MLSKYMMPLGDVFELLTTCPLRSYRFSDNEVIYPWNFKHLYLVRSRNLHKLRNSQLAEPPSGSPRVFIHPSMEGPTRIL